MPSHPTNDRKRVLTVAGARPQFVKAAVVSMRLRGMPTPPFEEILVHTGQHYDPMLSDVFFEELDMAPPQYHLGVGSHEPAVQAGIILERLDPIFDQERPDALLVYDDTTSTLAAALCATYRNVPVIHVEAGERAYRRTLGPEESNRVLTDHTAMLCLTATERARNYLLREGMSPARVRFVGDPMYDLFKWATTRRGAEHANSVAMGLPGGGYHLATIHRAENTVDREPTLSLLNTLDASRKPVILPAHPRLRNVLEGWGWTPQNNLRLIEPLGYFQFLDLLMGCDLCVTDSSGVTREAFFAGKPCIIPMTNSWWVEVVEAGWAAETGSDRRKLANALETFQAPTHAPEGIFGNGDSALQIVESVAGLIEHRPSEAIWRRHGANMASGSLTRGGTFTLASYAEMVRRIQERGYQFVSFPEAKARIEDGQPFALMRHDIDMSLEAALRMAHLEGELGVQSTYFFLVRTDHYNVFSQDGSDAVSRILDQGHNLGLHFDCASYAADLPSKDLAQACKREASMLEDWFGKPVSIVSYHRPDVRVLTGDPAFSAPLPHTYMDLFRSRIRYISDSGGRWGHGSPTASREFRRGLPLHILVHPIWWLEQPTPAYETLLRLIDLKTNSLECSIARNCKVFVRTT
jgi:UDP-GlcNAc3NAcA epimerase